MKSAILLSVLLGSSAFAQQLPIAGCNLQDFVVATGPTATIITQGRSYSPRCLKIKAGTQVIIDASSHHPLQGVVGSVGPVNPIFDEFGGAVQAKTVNFAEAGVFGFYCLAHSDDQGTGMGGAILVEP